jgi:hypothetical protein
MMKAFCRSQNLFFLKKEKLALGRKNSLAPFFNAVTQLVTVLYGGSLKLQ